MGGFLILRRENPLQRNAKVERQERLHVQVGLASAYRCDGIRRHSSQIRGRRKKVSSLRLGKHACGRRGTSGGWHVSGVRYVYVLRQLGDRERMRLLTALL